MNELLPLYDAVEMRALDAAAIDLGIPAAVLMERAGVGAAHEIMSRFPDCRRFATVAGTGNNGGDGFVVARHLLAAGLEPEVLLTGPATRLSAESRGNLDVAERLGVPVHRRPSQAQLRRTLRGAEVVIDALFGTGFRGAPRPAAARLIESINAAGRPVVALDIPSGVDASDGTVAGAAVTAELTVTFHGPKVGLIVAPGCRHAGAVVVADIGIPPQLESPTWSALATRSLIDLVPRKQHGTSKYGAGSVLVVGGSEGMSGAPLLAARAALRAGAGIAWVAVPASVAAQVGAAQPELMVRALPGGLELADRAGALALGPGLGRSVEAQGMVRSLAQRHRGPLVIDADGLFALAGKLATTARRRTPAVLTPHEGEMARLLGREPEWVASNRLAAVREAAAAAKAVVLLKGADTLVAAPGGDRVVVSVSDTPGLATAGSGDVLTGVVAAMLAKGLDPWTAACCGAVMHARAGRIAAEAIGPDGISRAQRLSRATVTIDLSAIAANVGMLRDLVAPAEVWAVVKADGYGHGASAVGGAALAAGATRLCVATWEEARALRDALPEAPVLVMSPLAPGEEADLAGVEVAVSSVESFARLRAATREPLGVHVKVDTGMGRWGMAEDEARRVADEIGGSSLLRLSGLMSHLSSADDDADHTRRQLERFRQFAEGLPDCPRHVANSAGALGYPEARFDAVRCGIAIYGLSPFGDDSAARGLAPALRLESYVAQLKLLEPGEGAGYGRRFVADRPTWIGLVPAGYADGVPRLLSGRMDVLVRGRRRRVAATISMDQLTFVVGEQCDVELGDPVVLIGSDGGERIGAEEWAARSDTIAYEIVCDIAPRRRRVEHVIVDG